MHFTNMTTHYKSRTTIPGSIDEILTPGDELVTVINNRNSGTTTKIMLEYTRHGILYNGVYYTKLSTMRKEMLKIYLQHRKTFEDPGWPNVFRLRDNKSLHTLREELNATRV
jgi:hypothetical protein